MTAALSVWLVDISAKVQLHEFQWIFANRRPYLSMHASAMQCYRRLRYLMEKAMGTDTP